MEAVAILTAVKDGSELLANFVRIGNNYRVLPTAVHRLADEISSCEHALDSWKAQYYLKNGRPTQYYEMLWGRNGWKSIRHTLGIISITCNQLNAEIDLLIDCATTFNRTSFSPETYSNRYDEELVRASIQRIKRKMSRLKRFNSAIVNKAGQIQTLLATFERQLLSLQRKSQRLIEKTHPEAFHDLHSLRGKALFLRVTGRDQSKYHWIRKDAEALHKVFTSSSQVTAGLGLTIINRPTDYGTEPPPRLPDKNCDFQLLLKSGTAAHEILVHPVKFSGDLQNPRFHRNFETALDELPTRGLKPSYLMPEPGAREGFTLHMSTSARLAEVRTGLTVKDSLGDIQSLYTKRDIAQTLAQGCCRLLGSPWLDYFDSDNIHIYPTGNTWAAFLRAVPGETRTAEVLSRVATNYRRGRRSLTQHAHIYRLGMALTEVLLETPISFIVYDRREGVKPVIESIGDQALEADEVAAEVDHVTGSERFGDVVFFCLAIMQDKELLPKEDLDVEFQTKVLEQ